MEFGEYEVVVQDEHGKAVRRFPQLTRAGRPMVGERIVIEDQVYRVRMVEHVDDPLPLLTLRRYSYPVIFCELLRTEPRKRKRREETTLSSPQSTPTSSGEGNGSPACNVIPFQQPRGAACTSWPFGFIAVLVACGYRAQATRFRERELAAWRRAREHDDASEADSARYWSRRSRQAKQECLKVLQFLEELGNVEVASPGEWLVSAA